MKSEIGIDVAAAPSRIFDLAANLEEWPRLLPHYRKVTVRSRDGGKLQATMVAVRRFGPIALPVSWTAEQWSDDADAADLRLRFHHVGGVTRGMDVTWHIRPRDAGGSRSRVTIEHEFSRRLPLVGSELLPRVVDRFFIRPIAGRTLATFKTLAEQPTITERPA